MVEICGGEARASHIAVRRHLHAGPNFDLVTMIDLTDPKHQHDTMTFIVNNDVFVAVMAPVCGPFGPLGRLNEHIPIIGALGKRDVYASAEVWTCEACLKRWPRERGHTMIQGECR